MVIQLRRRRFRVGLLKLALSVLLSLAAAAEVAAAAELLADSVSLDVAGALAVYRR
jgi:hypothetical protein